jgi:hypothetical protein
VVEHPGVRVDDQRETKRAVRSCQLYCGRHGTVAGLPGTEAAFTGPYGRHPQAAGQQADVHRADDTDSGGPFTVGAVQPGDHVVERVAQRRADRRREGQRERLHPGVGFRVELYLHLDHAAFPREPPPAVSGRVELGPSPGIVMEVPDALADQGDPALALGERAVLGHVRREQALRLGVVPRPQQPADRVPRRQRLRPRSRLSEALGSLSPLGPLGPFGLGRGERHGVSV